MRAGASEPITIHFNLFSSLLVYPCLHSVWDPCIGSLQCVPVCWDDATWQNPKIQSRRLDTACKLLHISFRLTMHYHAAPICAAVTFGHVISPSDLAYFVILLRFSSGMLRQKLEPRHCCLLHFFSPSVSW